MTSLMPGFSAQDVANDFVEQYYMILEKCPENTHKFYQESSLLGWPGPDGDVISVATLSGINDKIISSDYIRSSVETKTVDGQESFDGGVIVVVTGFWTGKDDVRKNFSQTFFLAKQEKGFFVLNDILRFVEVCGLGTNTAVHDDCTNDQAAPNQNSVPCLNSDHPASLPTKEVVENGNVVEASDLSVSKDTAVNVAGSTSSVSSSEDACPVLAPVSNIKKEANIPKATYASMVARKGPVTSPKIENVPSNSDNQRVALPTAKPSAPLGDGASKVSTPISIVSKPSAPPSNAVPKARTGSNGSPNSSPSAEARGVYIGRLPYEISKQGVMEVLKQFGPIKKNSDSIQIRRHEDGFCCAFVEFESADSARRAVEAHHVMFGEKEAYIAHKRSSSSFNRGNNDRGKSPSSSTGVQNANYRGQGNGEVNNGKFQNKNRTSYNKDQTRGSRRNTQSDRWSSEEVETGRDS